LLKPPFRFKLPFRVSLALLTVIFASVHSPLTASAQFQSSSSATAADSSLQAYIAPEGTSSEGSGLSTRGGIAPSGIAPLQPLSRIALSVGVSPLGVGLQAATNINRHFDVRGTGSFFNYTANNISTEGFNVTAKLKMASAGASVDYYPFHAGFRLSPGVLFYNGNKVDVTFLAASGTSFTLNDHTYYSAAGANAVRGVGAFGLGNGQAAFTMTTGWGNLIPASGKHLSFPFEVGAAFIKDPTVALNLTGYVCDAQGTNCVNVATDPTAQADLAGQIKKYQNDFNPLKTYPIVSFGVAYNFKVR